MKKPRKFASIGAMLRKNRVNKLGEHPICIRVTKNGEVCIIATEYSALKGDWDKRNNMPKNHHPDYEKVFSTLEERLKTIRVRMDELVNSNPDCSTKEIIDYYKKYKEPITVNDKPVATGENSESMKTCMTVKEYYDILMARMKSKGKHSTAGTYQPAFNWMNRKTPLDELKLYDITLSLLEDLWAFMVKEKEKEKLEGKRGVFEEATLFGYFKNYMALMNSAIAEGHISPLDSNFHLFKLHENFKPKVNPRPIPIISIKKIMDLDLVPYSRIWNSRNYFLFSFFANGINFKDLALLTRQDISSQRVLWQRNKTKVDCKAKLNPKVEEILKHYEGRCFQNYLFPILTKDYTSEQLFHRLNGIRGKTNKDLKVMQKLAGIEVEISFYTGRHSFVSALQDLNVPDNEIASFIGQSDGKALRNYLSKLSDKKSDAISDMVYSEMNTVV